MGNQASTSGLYGSRSIISSASCLSEADWLLWIIAMYRLLYNQLDDRMYLPDCTTRSLHRLHVALSIIQSISGYRYVCSHASQAVHPCRKKVPQVSPRHLFMSTSWPRTDSSFSSQLSPFGIIHDATAQSVILGGRSQLGGPTCRCCAPHC